MKQIINTSLHFLSVFLMLCSLYISTSFNALMANSLKNTEVESQFLKLQKSIISGLSTADSREKSFKKVENIISALDDKQSQYYWLARIEFERARLLDVNQEATADLFENSQQLVKKSLKLGKFSDGYRLLSDTYMHQMSYRGVLYQIANGGKLASLPLKALELNPQNVSAKISYALFLINAPSFAGGDVKKAIRELQTVSQSNNPMDQFWGYYFLAEAFNKIENHQKAYQAIEKSLTIFPNNLSAQKKEQELSKQVKQAFSVVQKGSMS